MTTRLLAPFARTCCWRLAARARAPGTARRPRRPRALLPDLSETSSYYRFFGARSVIPEAELRRTTEQDVNDHVTLVVDANGELIAIGEYYALAGR